MEKFFTTLLLIILFAALLTGCQKVTDGNGDIKSARPSTVSTGKITTEATGASIKNHDLIGEEVLDMQEELDNLTKDMEDLENFGGDAIVPIDRELDVF
ncbi:MAG TPA: hypothetical protein VE439_02015 [Anaerolineae bacterium]|nr:hypothetical protein [Anaerolineae bacterium]